MQKVLVTIVFLVITSVVLLFFSLDSLPTSTLYNVKRLKENAIILTRTTPDAKARYYSELLDIRLHELEQLVPRKNDHNLILPVALRYSTTAGEYTKVIKENGLVDEAKEALLEFKRHTKILNQLIKKYPRVNIADRGDTYIIDSVNYLEIYEKELPK